MTTLCFYRAAHLFTLGTLLVVGTMLMFSGMFVPLLTILLFSIAVSWFGFVPQSARAYAEHEWDALSASVKPRTAETLPGYTRASWSRPRAFLARRRVRKERTLPVPRFDVTLAVLNTLVWACYVLYLAGAIAGL